MTIIDNKPFKVLIPTAGTGSRLDDLTKYINKSLVSIENKPVISRIINMFPQNTEFVIALGYKGDLVRQFLELAYPNKKFEFAIVENYEGEGSGLGISILECEKYLQQPFIFCSCDTIVTDEISYTNKNIAYYSDRDNKDSYRTLDMNGKLVTNILEKNNSSPTSKPYIGLCCIKDFELFWHEMHNGKDEAIKIGESYALKKLASKGILYGKKVNWFDTGNKEELEKTKQFFKKENSPNILPKPDESIWFIDDKVIKYSNNKNFIIDRVNRVQYLQNYVPNIQKYTENMYTYNKVEGQILSKLENIDIFKKLLDYSKKFWQIQELNIIEKEKFKEICKNFYYDKTISRIKKYYEVFSSKDENTTINGRKIPKLSTLLNKIDWEWIYNGLAGRFHGDFHFENILYNEQNDKFIFLDWRQNFGGLFEYGDIYYDLAKLLHGLIICHELIAKDKYNVEINGTAITYNFERKEILIDCEEYYYKWLEENRYDVKKVKVLTALIYLNIAALHHYPYCHLLYNLGKTTLFGAIE